MSKSNIYKRLGDFIQRVDVRNTEDLDIPLMGLSITKQFIPSIANTIGTNMKRYKIIKRNQFAYSPVTSRNGEKMTIALFKDYDQALVSQAYVPFEIISSEELLPDYLMMWFSRPEFDRYARFKSHGSARETFDWDEMCDVELPVPSLKEQQRIVAEYQAVENKIKVNEQICEKLEESAQTLYKQWFVEFEFPFDFAQGEPNEEGKPYKSSGGEMVWNEELEKEVPVGWEVFKIGEIVEDLGGGTPKTAIEEYWNEGSINWYSPTDITNNNSIFINNSERKITELGINNSSAKLFPEYSLMMTSRATVGKMAINTMKSSTNQGFITLIPTDKFKLYFLFCWLSSKIEKIISLASGSTFLEISKTNFRNLNILTSDSNLETKFNKKVENLFSQIRNRSDENIKLRYFQSLLLSRMVRV